jgi:hypothetical protein
MWVDQFDNAARSFADDPTADDDNGAAAVC